MHRQIYYDPQHVTAAIVNCGGLCPGTNDVVQSESEVRAPGWPEAVAMCAVATALQQKQVQRTSTATRQNANDWDLELTHPAPPLSSRLAASPG